MCSSRWSIIAKGTNEAATKTGRRMQAASKRSTHAKEAREIHQRVVAQAVGLTMRERKVSEGLTIPKCHDGSAALCDAAALEAHL